MVLESRMSALEVPIAMNPLPIAMHLVRSRRLQPEVH